jgi:hypothetical protein
LSLDANRWMREGILEAGRFTRGSWQWAYHGGETASIGYEADLRQPGRETATLIYTRGRPPEVERLRYEVELTATVPRFGGLRWWFVCPLVVRGVSCCRRVGKLYLPGGAATSATGDATT